MFHTARVLCIALSVSAPFMLSACSSGSGAALTTFKLLNPFEDITSGRPLNPKLTYLRATSNGTPLLMVQGGGDAAQGDLFYTASAEVFGLKQGRLQQALGVPGEWRAVRSDNVPAWTRSLNFATYQRQRDLTAQGRYAIREDVSLQRLVSASPSRYKQSANASYQPSDLTWFRETYTPLSKSEPGLPPALFGVLFAQSGARVVYSEQCIDAQLCLSFQEWPSTPQKP